MIRTRTLVTMLALAGAALSSAAQAADVGVSIGISQPGVYGRIDIGRFPQPAVVQAQPVIIAAPPARVAVQPVQPVYLWVPPGHQKHWRKHCAQYNACGVPVYFVQERWYHDHGPGREWREHREHGEHDGHDGHGRGHDGDHGRGHDRR